MASRNMGAILVALGLYLSLADCVLGGSLETSPDMSAVAKVEDSYALQGEPGWSWIWWSLNSCDSLKRQELDRVRIPNPSMMPARRSLLPKVKPPKGTTLGKSGSKAKKLEIIACSVVVGLFMVFIPVCWCRRQREKDLNWKVGDVSKC